MGVIHLVKHAQVSDDASGTASVSPLGRQQGRRLGGAMSASAIDPDIVASGTFVPHRQTVDAMTGDQPVDVLTDEGWNDFDHRAVLARQEPDFDHGEPGRAELQRWSEQACLRWSSGRHDAEYDETFADFTERVARAKLSLVARMSPDAVAVVLSGGGPIAWIATALLSGWTPGQDPYQHAEAWCRANAVVVNTSVTKVALAPRGLTLVSFNDHSHLERDSRTFR